MRRLTSLARRLGPPVLAVVLVTSAAAPAARAEEPQPGTAPGLAAEPTPGPDAEPTPTSELVPRAEPTPTPALDPAPAADPTPDPTPAPEPTPAPTPTPLPALAVALGQRAVSLDADTNRATVRVTATPSGFVVPWRYAIAVRGNVVASGESSAGSIVVTVVNDCSITTQSVSVEVTDAADRTAGAAATLDRSLCPPPPDVPHASDRIMAGPTLTEASFVDRLRAVGSPALAEGRDIYRTLVAAGVNPAFALGTFHAESHSGTRGYAVTTRNWGNILYYSWQAAYGAVPYAPGNGYTYAKYPTWLASVRAYAQLLTWYDERGYTTVSSASAHWLGTKEGSTRHLTYLGNITYVMRLLPDDAVPVVRSLTVPATSRAAVAIAWTARDNLAVTGYQLRTRLAGGPWSTPEAVTGQSRTLVLGSGSWTIGVRATDAAGNWSAWRTATVAVDAVAPSMTALAPSERVARANDGAFRVTWRASDNVGVTRYQLRTRKGEGTWSSPVKTTARSRDLAPGPGSWTVAVRARDAVGNWSAWREIRVVVPRDDRHVAFSAGTARRSGAPFFRGTLTSTRVARASLVTSFSGTAFYLVGPSGPGYGRMRITVDGTSTIVDAGLHRGLPATKTRHHRLLFSVSLPPGPHTVVVTNLATPGRPAIAVDGIGFAH
jgi:hypothetical protein